MNSRVELQKDKMKNYFAIAFMLIAFGINAQGDKTQNGWSKKLKDYKIKPIIGLQLWSTYTFDTKIFDEEIGKYRAVDNRFNTQIRRTRLGIKGQPYQNLKFNFTTSLDLVGRDILAATQGGGNNGGSPIFRIWNAYLQWKISKKNDGLNLTVGYIPPQIGRESITSALRVSSMEKSWSQNYLRRQLVGTGPGRALGINIGGLFLDDNKNWGWSYDVEIFNPVFQDFGGNSVGEEYAPLLVGRVALYLGDGESVSYTISHKTNYMNQRKGFTIAFAGTHQGETILFKKQVALGIDWLLNWNKLNFDGEWTFLTKTGERFSNNQNTSFYVDSNTGYTRISYNLTIPKGRVVEPVFMMTQFNGALDATHQADAIAVKAFAGKDYAFDLGINYYWNPDLKFSFHYILRNADAGDAGDGATFNNYYFQNGVGAIQRGNWLGVGVVSIF